MATKFKKTAFVGLSIRGEIIHVDRVTRQLYVNSLPVNKVEIPQFAFVEKDGKVRRQVEKKLTFFTGSYDIPFVLMYANKRAEYGKLQDFKRRLGVAS